MPRPLRTVKPPSAPGATAKKPTTAKVSAAKSRTTRSGTKDIPDTESGPLSLPTPSSDEPSKKSSSIKKSTTTSTKTIVTKRSTRSKAPTTIIEETAPTPKPRTTRRKPAAAAKESEPVVEAEIEQTTEEPEPFLPTTASPLPPSTPGSQVPASSNAENHTPSTQFRSSPPPIPSTPPPQTATKRRIVLEFSSDAGYSPPPRPTSAERPRLRELQPVSLEPLDPTESEVDDENIDPRASPTPKRGRKSGFVPVEEERGGRPSAFYIPGVDEEEGFTIYSDPKTPTPPTLPRNTAFDDTMRPPESSPAATPVKMRKRRSSGVVVDSDDDVAGQGNAEDETEKAADRKGKRRKAIEKVRLMTTADLRDLLPRRKKNVKAGEKDEYDVISTSEDAVESGDDSSDELSRPAAGRTTRSGRAGTKKAAAKVKPAKTTKTAKKTTTKSRNATSTVPKLPSSTRVSKTYTRKSFSSEKENDSPTKSRNRSRRDSAVDVAGPSSSGDETVVPDMGGKSGRRKLKEVVEKFKEVDRWDLEFEDVSPRSLEIESEGAR